MAMEGDHMEIDQPADTQSTKAAAEADPSLAQASIDQIRQMWKWPALCQFLHQFKFFTDDTAQLEQLLMTILTNQIDAQLVDLLMKVMRLTIKMIISQDNYKQIACRIVEQYQEYIRFIEYGSHYDWQNYHKMEFEDASVDFKAQWALDIINYQSVDWTPQIYVNLLHFLCELALLIDPQRIIRRKFAKSRRVKQDDEEEDELLRVDPIGVDSSGDAYYLFDDNRMYQINGDQCQLLCATLPQWQSAEVHINHLKHDDLLILANGKIPKNVKSDRELYDLIVSEYKPYVVQHLHAKMRELNKSDQPLPATYVALRPGTRSSSRQEAKVREESLKAASVPPAASTIPESGEAQHRDVSDQDQQNGDGLPKMSERDQRLLEREQKLLWRQQQFELKKQRDEQKLAKRNQQKLKLKAKSNVDWYFDCYCLVKGKNYDDGQALICCSRCNVWRHVACVNQYHKSEGDWADRDFVCWTCQPHRFENLRGDEREDAFDLIKLVDKQ